MTDTEELRAGTKPAGKKKKRKHRRGAGGENALARVIGVDEQTATDHVIKRAAQEIIDKTCAYLERHEIRIEDPESGRRGRRALSEDNFDELVRQIRACRDYPLQKYADVESLSDLLSLTWVRAYPALQSLEPRMLRSVLSAGTGKYARRRCRDTVASVMSRERILTHLKRNGDYVVLASRIEEEETIGAQLAAYLEGGMPSDYTMLYPRARRMKRSFILHLGPTNSGKTYDAIQDLMHAKTGAYLAPLRLMAYEQYETMTEAGVPCRMLTGEEEIGDIDASHVSSTIEMADDHAVYEVAVIDEAQMIADRERGGAWTAAVLGICAERVHVCAAPEAGNIVMRLVEACGDDIEVVMHERMVPLEADLKRFRFPKAVEKGDALVVFSRKSVHAVANVLQGSNIPCSVIYGALPYDVRHEEVRKFREGETDVVVATDAIGMGMNLPIRRVVFIEEEKFDGENRRPLLPEEIRQIAGRAGRYGKYDIGYYTCTGDPELLAAGYQTATPQIEEAVIRIPKGLLEFDARLSGILSKWSRLPVQEGFIKTSVEREIKLAERLEAMSDDKELIYEFINLKFDEDEPTLVFLWETCFRIVLEGGSLEDDVILDDCSYITSMSGLELLYRQYDLFYSCLKRLMPQSEKLAEIDAERRRITQKLMSLLSEQEFESRRCKRCGKPLSFGYRYGICEKCFEQTRFKRALPKDKEDDHPSRARGHRGGKRRRRH